MDYVFCAHLVFFNLCRSVQGVFCMRNLTIAIMMFITTLGPSLIIAAVGYAAIRAIGRNPSAAAKILVALIFAFLFAEGIAVIALVLIYNLFK